MAERNETKTNRLVVRLATAAIAMFGFGFALVPLYDVFVISRDSTVKTSAKVLRKLLQWIGQDCKSAVRHRKPADMPWDFKPTVRSMRVHWRINIRRFTPKIRLRNGWLRKPFRL